MNAVTLLTEMWRSVRALRGHSLLHGAISFLCVCVVALLMAQAMHQRLEFQRTLEQPQFRTAAVVDIEGRGVVPWSSGDDIAQLSSVERGWVEGEAIDVFNAALPARGRVSGVPFGGSPEALPLQLVAGRLPARPGEAIVPVTNLQSMGFDSSMGVLGADSGDEWAVVGAFEPSWAGAPDHAFLFPTKPGEHARSVNVTVRTRADLKPTLDVVRSVVAAPSAALSVESEGSVEGIGDQMSDSLSSSTRTIIWTTLATAIGVLSCLALLMANSRRPEFGRRRALGATRPAIVLLVSTQVGFVVLVGGAVGVLTGGLVSLWLWGAASVSPGALAATLILVTSGAVLAQLPSALVSALMDPVKVLRSA